MTTQSQAARIVATIHAGNRAKLSNEPLQALQLLGFTLAAVTTPLTTRGSQGWCDGLSFSDGRAIVYRATPDSRRENFTLLHEFAHFLVSEDDTALDWLADLPDTAKELERLCDAIAAELLLPSSAVDAVIKSGPVRAEHAISLYDNTQASNHAVAVRLAGRLPCAGSVFMVNANTHQVAFAANTGNLQVWPWKNQSVPHTHVLRRLDPNETITTASFWTTPWNKRQDFYIDARRRVNWSHVILAERDIWNTYSFHVESETEDTWERPVHQLTCPCGYSGSTMGGACAEAQHPYCPRCKECLCHYGTRNQVRCPNPLCNLTVPANDIRDGRCGMCG